MFIAPLVSCNNLFRSFDRTRLAFRLPMEQLTALDHSRAVDDTDTYRVVDGGDTYRVVDGGDTYRVVDGGDTYRAAVTLVADDAEPLVQTAEGTAAQLGEKQFVFNELAVGVTVTVTCEIYRNDTLAWEGESGNLTLQAGENTVTIQLKRHTHTWDDGEVTTQPTETEEGEKNLTCTACGKTKTETIPALEHTHTIAAAWSSDETHHWHEADCGRTEHNSDTATHTWNDGEVTTQPTATADGEKTYTCAVCGATKTETIPVLEHSHTIAAAWSSDETHHWHEASCDRTEHNTDTAAHTWDDGEVTKQPTETETGEKTLTCTVCGKTKTEAIPALGHTHTIAAAWSSDETHHWHEADCGKAEHNTDTAAHTWDDGEVTTQPTETEDGEKMYTCAVCGTTKTEAIPALGHTHTIAAAWSSDETHHWHEASCGKAEHNTDTAAHTWDDGEVTTQPTATADGEKTYTCAVCGATKTTNIALLETLGAYKVLADSELATYGVTATSIPAKMDGYTYVAFGTWPQTIIASGVTVDESVNVTQGAHTYYAGSDGAWYVKVTAKLPTGPELYVYHICSDGTELVNGIEYWFKVEPIVWRVLTNDYSRKKLLLAEKILTANVPWYGNSGYTSITYEESNIRAWLNGTGNQYTPDWTGKGFLQTAFTESQQIVIAETVVDNSAESTVDTGNNMSPAKLYICADTTDKVFLLSLKEATTSTYGFATYNASGQGNTRIRMTTDYAKANYANQNPNKGNGGQWWLRSRYNSSYAEVSLGSRYDGCYSYITVSSPNVGIVPALCVTQ